MANDSELSAGLTCFIVSPIGNKLDPLGTDGRIRYEDNMQMWADVLEPACHVFSLKAIRADRIAETGEITEQIFQYLRDADVVIADLSGANPNVMYELGLRHTRDKITIQIGEHGRLPFDINTIRTIQFKRTEAGLIEARNGLVNALRAGLEGKGSPVSATRIWNEGEGVGAASIELAVRRSLEADDDVEDYEPGIVDMMAEGEASLHEVAGTLNETSGIITQIGQLTTAAAEKLKESDSKGKGFAGRLMVAKGLASALSEPTQLLEGRATDFLDSVTKVDTMVNFVLDCMEEDDPADVEEAQGFLTSVRELIDSADESAVHMAGFVEQAVGMRKLAKDLVPVSRTIERSINRYLKGSSMISDWRPRIDRLLPPEEEAA